MSQEHISREEAEKHHEIIEFQTEKIEELADMLEYQCNAVDELIERIERLREQVRDLGGEPDV